MRTIELNQLKFKVCHGLFKLEETVPQEFVLDIKLEMPSYLTYPIQLAETTDYTEVYPLIASIMHQREELIENLVLKINQQVLASFPEVVSIHCRITKWPALGGPGHVVFEARDCR
ncbi:MAG: dihydroneopterin aldolase [Saprospiraceae bacterium]|nr:dihydroneopterin aldolase [Saprospiraceae bacterium]